MVDSADITLISLVGLFEECTLLLLGVLLKLTQPI
jgi:hypothetical protein